MPKRKFELRDDRNAVVSRKELEVGPEGYPFLVKWRGDFYILKGVNKRATEADYRKVEPADLGVD
jgi:hypothetical protein